MPVDAFLLVLGSATLHAVWNVLLAGSADTRAATAGTLGLLSVVCLPLAILTWDFEPEVLPYLTLSVVLEIGYFVLLAAAYSRADLGVVYPIARGAAPVLVLVVGVLAGRGEPGPLQVAGVALVAAGVVILRGGAAPTAGRDVALALAVGATIAGYVVADDAGLEHAATVPYLGLVVGLPGLAYAAAFAATTGARTVRPPGPSPPPAAIRPAARAGSRALLRQAATARTAVTAAAMLASLGLALAALEQADPAPVAAIREGSVVIAAVLAPTLLGERGGRARLAGAAAVFAGVAAVAVG